MEHLLDFFDGYVRGSRMSLLYDDGLRVWSYTGDQVRAAADAFARRLIQAGIQPAARVVIWGDNRPEWVSAFWGCMLRGVAVIPLDARASPELVQRIVAMAAPGAIVAADDITDVPAVPASCMVWRFRDVEWPDSTTPPTAARADVGADTIAEIVFTSGTTGEPKGVLITHGNIVANIAPIERAKARYTHYLWAFRPIRFLGLLPLSHMFGQALTLFLPPLVNGAVVFVRGYNPDSIIQQIRAYRITLGVTVPRMLDLLRARVAHRLPECAHPASPPPSLARRWWRYRRARRLFGWRFCGFVVGGADLEHNLEEYWRGLGYAVVQGYGLTETAPIVAWNDPFDITHGTVGSPLEGVDVRIAPDGEVLVRGPSVTAGYFNAPEETRAAFEEGWFHTGDIGAFDQSGHLVIRGRKKDVIVTAEGIHVFPEDVERVLNVVPGVREAAVVGAGDGGEHVHAVLVLERDVDAAAVVREANGVLPTPQHIKAFSIWPDAALPRTEAIRKLKRHEIRRWVAEGAPRMAPAARPEGGALEQALAPYAHDRPVTAQTTLDELGLTSLDRIEVAMALEERTGVGISDAAVGEAATVGDLQRAVDEAQAGEPRTPVLALPRWARHIVVRMIRDVSQVTWMLPLVRPFLWLHVKGLEQLEAVHGSVIFAANHQSHLDTPAILTSLPPRWRRRLAIAMGEEFFDPYFLPAGHGIVERARIGMLYHLAVFFLNGFPLPRTEPGARETLRYIGELATAGQSILIFPEGHRTERGEIRTFQAGVGMMAARLRLPVIPVRLEGLERVLHHTWRWPRPGPVRITFGAPLHLEGTDYAALARRVEAAVVALGGAPTSHPRSAAA